MNESEYCEVDTCDQLRAGNTTKYCGRHRARFNKYGDPTFTLRSPFDEPGIPRGGSRHKYTEISWNAMRDRCLNKNARSYPQYGGRGIVICDSWLGASGFDSFFKDMGERPQSTTLDRINNDGNYEPGNCRWATASEQQRNTRRSLASSTKEIYHAT